MAQLQWVVPKTPNHVSINDFPRDRYFANIHQIEKGGCLNFDLSGLVSVLLVT